MSGSHGAPDLRARRYCQRPVQPVLRRLAPRLCLRQECEERKFGRAVPAQRMLARDAAADVQHGRLFVVEATGIAAPKQARRDERADVGEANLPPMIMAGKHQVELVLARPEIEVGRMGEEQPKRAL